MCSVVLNTLCTVQGTPYGAICSLQCSMICTQHDTVHIAQCFENYTAHCECAMYYVDWAAEVPRPTLRCDFQTRTGLHR